MVMWIYFYAPHATKLLKMNSALARCARPAPRPATPNSSLLLFARVENIERVAGLGSAFLLQRKEAEFRKKEKKKLCLCHFSFCGIGWGSTPSAFASGISAMATRA
jgi:hypothetical protein